MSNDLEARALRLVQALQQIVHSSTDPMHRASMAAAALVWANNSISDLGMADLWRAWVELRDQHGTLLGFLQEADRVLKLRNEEQKRQTVGEFVCPECDQLDERSILSEIDQLRKQMRFISEQVQELARGES